MAIKISLIMFLGLAAAACGQIEYGLAAQYPRDAGIAQDPAVIFTEDFEEASVTQMVGRWEDYKYEERMSFTGDVPALSGGGQSLFMNGFADLYRRILPGYDTVYARFYAKLDTSCNNVHHWAWLGGHSPSTAWPWPRAGTKPAGDERWSTGIEPHGRMSRWDFYTYWKDMRIDRDGNYWGNTFASTLDIPVVEGEWLCVEFMVIMNSPPAASNGEQAFWINGEKKFHIGPGFPTGQWDFWSGLERGTWFTGPGAPFPGFQWRTVPDLNINYFWLEHYVDSDPGCECWFDDVVIATEYIGPLAASSAADRRTPNHITSGPRLEACAPSPFIHATRIRYSLPEARAGAQISICDLSGKQIKRLPLNAQSGHVLWNGTGDDRLALPSGVYIIRLDTEKHSVTKSVVKFK